MKALKNSVERILNKQQQQNKQTNKPTQELPLEIQVEKCC